MTQLREVARDQQRYRVAVVDINGDRRIVYESASRALADRQAELYRRWSPGFEYWHRTVVEPAK